MKLCTKLHKTVRSSSMERVEEFESNKVNHCTIFSVLTNITFDFMIYTMVRKVNTWICEVVHKLHKNVRNSSMKRVEKFESIKVKRCTIFSVLRKLTFNFMIDTIFRKVRTLIGEIVHEIAQNCQTLIYGESWAVQKHQTEPLKYM